MYNLDYPMQPKLKYNCIHCMNQLQKNIAKTQRKSHPTPQIPPMKVRKNVTNYIHMNKPCWAKFNHCKLTGHQTNPSQEDTGYPKYLEQ